MRLLLNARGEVSITSTDLTPVDGSTVFNVVLASERTRSNDRFLYHKTTNRAFYDNTRMRLPGGKPDVRKFSLKMKTVI